MSNDHPTHSDSIVPTPEQLRGVSHPVRSRLLGMLRIDGPQTSTDLARRTGLNTGATSYHLRMLAQHGFIEDAPELGKGRERYWRARHRMTRTTEAVVDDAIDDVATYRQAVLSRYAEMLQAGVAEWAELPPAWRATTALSDYPLRVTPEQAREVLARLEAVLEEAYAQYGLDAPAPQGAEVYSLYLCALPLPGRIPHREPDDISDTGDTSDPDDTSTR